MFCSIVVNLPVDIHFTCNFKPLKSVWLMDFHNLFIHTSNIIRCPREITCGYVTFLAVLFNPEPGDISLLTVKLLNYFVPPPERDYCVTRVVVQSGIAERWLLLKQTQNSNFSLCGIRQFLSLLCEKQNFFITAFTWCDCAFSGYIYLNFNTGLQFNFRTVVLDYNNQLLHFYNVQINSQKDFKYLTESDSSFNTV